MTTRPRALRRLSAVLAVGFAALAVQVASAGEVPGDRALLEAVVRLADGRADLPARLVDRATDTLPLAGGTALVVALLVGRGNRCTGVRVAVCVGGALGGNPLLKQLVARPRPDLLEAAADVSPLAFPSGHAAGTAALAVAAVLATRDVRRRAGVVAAAVLLVTVTAASQLVLARHAPSDLLGGWLWAVAWTTLVWSAPARLPRGRAP